VQNPALDPITHDPPRLAADGLLFAWRDRTVVLLAEQAGDRWIVARGWLAGDRLAHVRRWTFATAPALAGQIRRLVREATGDARHASSAAAEFLAWAADRTAIPIAGANLDEPPPAAP